MLDDIILLILVASIVPLLLTIFFYVTKPSKHWWRVGSRAWLNPVGIQIVGQKTILVLLLGFITLSRFAPGIPGRQWIGFALYVLLVGAFWAFFIIQRNIQRPYERAQASKKKEKS